MKTKHTPGPYRYDETWAIVYGADNVEIAACHSNKADAAFIVRACNTHAELVTALENLLEKSANFEAGGMKFKHYFGAAIFNAHAALAKAKGEA
jgi:hypothetical protein